MYKLEREIDYLEASEYRLYLENKQLKKEIAQLKENVSYLHDVLLFHNINW